MSLRKEFYKNILISGGTSMLPGFPTRLKEDIYQRYQDRVSKTSSVRIRVIDTPSRKYNVFIGASVVAKET